jgi:RNA polymerase sigma factor (sigma-70 family)
MVARAVLYQWSITRRPSTVGEFRRDIIDVQGDGQTDIATLVAAATAGDAQAWSEIVHRYGRLLIRVLLPYRLTPGELEDVAQTVWLRLIEHIGRLREPRALPKWIITTARHEAIHVATRPARMEPTDPHDPAWLSRLAIDDQADAELTRAERHLALLEGLATLSPRQRQLMALLSEDPPVAYAEISRRTGIPMGAIGPTRARALERLRATPAVQAMQVSDENERRS